MLPHLTLLAGATIVEAKTCSTFLFLYIFSVTGHFFFPDNGCDLYLCLIVKSKRQLSTSDHQSVRSSCGNGGGVTGTEGTGCSSKSDNERLPTAGTSVTP